MRKRFVRILKECVDYILIIDLKVDFAHASNIKNKGSEEDCFIDC